MSRVDRVRTPSTLDGQPRGAVFPVARRYNWGAPFRMGFNTLSVNGKTCTCLASSHMSLTKLKVARDETLRIFEELMA